MLRNELVESKRIFLFIFLHLFISYAIGNLILYAKSLILMVSEILNYVFASLWTSHAIAIVGLCYFS